ncbi:MAG: hypothetical protein EAZ08_01630 [Cytophagales bacterium]|nr:MAG: hypothetical protein EAZ08_01630 [Cytophagales bacterium]
MTLKSYSTGLVLCCSYLFLLLYACTPAAEILTAESSAKLSFSKDTIFFDTLFSSQPTFTRRLVVFNDAKQAVNIDEIAIASGQNSPYLMTINGETNNKIQNIRLLGRDSLLILLTAKINPKQQDLPFTVRDSLIFSINGNRQEVKIWGWGQDAFMLKNQRISQHTVWAGKKPYIINGILTVDSLASLSIEEGVTVYLELGAAILVKGSLLINGTLENRVNFRGARLDEKYKEVPGQWDAIYFDAGSKNNRIKYARLQNGNVGLRIGAPPDQDTIPELVVENTIIENMRLRGLIAFSSDVYMVNTQINNCTQNAVSCVAGGTYTFLHCTFANTETRFFTEDPTVFLSNFYKLPDASILKSPLAFYMTNCISWGDRINDFQVTNLADTPAKWLVRNCLLKTNDKQFENNNNILNQRPRFKSALRLDFSLDSLSPAIDKGLDIDISTDIVGIARGKQPDIGAYERKK